MAEKRVERRLAAILAADVAGYSRLMGVDEEGTLAALKACRRELIDPKIAEHRGRIVKTTGDGALVEFASAVDAVRCAMDIQRAMGKRNATIPEDRRIEFRIGINVGDIIIDEGDIYGDGVNIAARVETLARPGAICISDNGYQQIKGKLALDVSDMGEQQLKNIAQPVRVYSIKGTVPRRASSGAATSAVRAPMLSIVVLPFANLGGDADRSDQDYFVDGLTEDLTTELSRLPGSFVIARNTAFTFKGKPIDVKRIGHELGVRYALEGSVRKMGTRVRVNAQLIDAETGGHLWADRFDRNLIDLFELQDSITIELARALGVMLVEAENRSNKKKLSPDSFDLEMQARAAWNRGWSRENIGATNRLYSQALELNPDSVSAMTGLATGLVIGVVSLWSEAREADLQRAEALAVRAVALDPHNASCHYAMGLMRRMQSRFDDAIGELDAAIRLNPNMQLAYITLGITKILAGRGQEALSHFADAIRLSPRDPLLFMGHFGIGWAQFMRGDDDQAVAMLRKSIALNPEYSQAHLFLTAAYAMQDRNGDARDALAAYLRTNPTFNTINLLRANAQSTDPVYMAQRERLYEGMRRAGLPE